MKFFWEGERTEGEERLIWRKQEEEEEEEEKMRNVLFGPKHS